MNKDLTNMDNLTFLAQLEKAEEIDGRYFVSGVASTTDRDEQNDILTEKCLKEMAATAVGVAVVQKHSSDSLDSIGSIVESKYDDNKLFIKAELDADDALAVRTWKKIQKSKKIGFSIGANVKKLAKNIDNRTRMTVDSVDWLHCAIVSNPANKNTFCMALNKTLEVDMPEEITIVPEEVKPEVPPEAVVITKVGATLSAASKSKIQAIHDASSMDEVKSLAKDLLDSSTVTEVNEGPDTTLDVVAPTGPAEMPPDNSPPTEAPDTFNILTKEYVEEAIKTAVSKAVTEVKAELEKSRVPKPPENPIIEKSVKTSMPYTTADAVKLNMLRKLNHIAG